MHLYRSLSSRKNNSSQTKYFLKNKMIWVCVFQCINLGHLYQFMVSKDLKAEIGITNIEDLFMFIQLRRNHLNLKLIKSNNFIQIFIKLQVKIFLYFLKDISQGALQVELTWQMFLLIKNMKMQFLKNYKNKMILNIYLQSEIHNIQTFH